LFSHLFGLDIFLEVSIALRIVIDVHVLALPGSSRAHRDFRLEKSVPKAPDFEHLMPFIYGLRYVW
jgi:hypothetical protein